MQNRTEDNFSETAGEVITFGDIKYFGCIIRKEAEGYSYAGQSFNTLTEAKIFIDNRFMKWNASLSNE
jgi:hypothetical protein